MLHEFVGFVLPRGQWRFIASNGAAVGELRQGQAHRVFLFTNAANRRAPSVAKLNTDESISHASKQKRLAQCERALWRHEAVTFCLQRPRLGGPKLMGVRRT